MSAKQAIELSPPNYTLWRSWQSSLGVQRELGHDLVLTADWARRQGPHFNLTNDLDINRTNWFVNGVTHPIIPLCTPAQRYVPGQECVQSPINEWKGVQSMKRCWSRCKSVSPPGSRVSFPMRFKTSLCASKPRHGLHQRGSQQLPDVVRSDASPAQSESCRDLPAPLGIGPGPQHADDKPEPFTATTNGVDLSGTGVSSSTPLPGIQYGCLAVNCSKSDMAKAVASFNANYAGTKAPNGATIPLPYCLRITSSAIRLITRIFV